MKKYKVCWMDVKAKTWIKSINIDADSFEAARKEVVEQLKKDKGESCAIENTDFGVEEKTAGINVIIMEDKNAV